MSQALAAAAPPDASLGTARSSTFAFDKRNDQVDAQLTGVRGEARHASREQLEGQALQQVRCNCSCTLANVAFMHQQDRSVYDQC